MSIYRVTIIGDLSLGDAPWSDVDPCVWSAVEVCVGIVSACLPTLRPLWTVLMKPRPIFRNLQGWRDGDESQYFGGLKLSDSLGVSKSERSHATAALPTNDVERAKYSAG